MTATAAKPQSRDGALTHRQVMTILTGLLLGMFLAALDQTIVATAIRRIGDDLNGLSAQAWVTTAFLITSTITTPLYGKLSDIYGRKPLFLIAIVIFIAGSALCGLATSMYMLAAFRAFQGIGAGGSVLPRARDPGRHRLAAGSAPVHGLLHGGVRDVERSGTGDRRLPLRAGLDLRRHRLALDLLRQRADRTGRAGRRQPGAAHPAHPARPRHRLAGRADAGHRPGAVADHRRAGPGVGLGISRRVGVLPHRTRRAHRVRVGRGSDGRRGVDPAAVVPLRAVLGRRRPVVRDRYRDVRRHRVDPAVPADRQGRVADEGRPADPAHGAGHHGRRQ